MKISVLLRFGNVLYVICCLLLGGFSSLLFCGCSHGTSKAPAAPNELRVKYIPITDEESFSGFHWIKYSVDYEDERYGTFTNTQSANVIKQTYKADTDGSFVVDYSDLDTYDSKMPGFPPRPIYKQANIYYENFYDVNFRGYGYEYYDHTSFAQAYVAWRIVFVGTDWEFYQPIFHVYKIYYTYIERNADETITFYRCDFNYRIHYNEDWLVEVAENKDNVPTYD